jgi:hypothetical protein
VIARDLVIAVIGKARPTRDQARFALLASSVLLFLSHLQDEI